MRTRLINYLDTLRANYWFLPSLLAAGALILAFGVVYIDETYGTVYQPIIEQLPISRDPGGARDMMSTIVGAIISVAGVSFSITIVAMTLAAQQFGPRLLDNFMRDRANQLVLGVFVAVPLYCLVVLWSIQGTDGDFFVPQMGILLGVILGGVSMAALIFFIHHVAESIRVSRIIDRVGDDMRRRISTLDDKTSGVSIDEVKSDLGDQVPANFHEEAAPVRASENGYLLSVDEGGLFQLAKEKNLLIKQLHRPGDFITFGGELVLLWPGSKIDDDLKNRVNGLFALDVERSQIQDIDFLFHKLSEIAMRAMSPGINDPHTAMMCIDRIGAGLAQIGLKDLPSPYRYDEDNTLRVVARVITFDALAHTAFSQIRHYASEDLDVLTHMLVVMERVARQIHSQSDNEDALAVMRDHIELTGYHIENLDVKRWNMSRVQMAYRSALAALEGRRVEPAELDLSNLAG
jgi:uncharacterized membrane protein